MRTSLLSLLAATFALTCQSSTSALAQAGPGYSLADGVFAGRFEDDLGDALVLQQSGREVTGTWTGGVQPYAVTGRIADGRLTGTTTASGIGGEPCSGVFVGETLQFTFRTVMYPLRRTVEPLAALADLGAPIVDEARQWTVAVYLAGDNNFEPGAVLDLLELQKGMPATGVEVVVLIDRAKGFLTNEQDDWTDTHLLHVRPGTDGAFNDLAAAAELDTGSPATLAGFVTGVFRKFPAPHHAVVLWDHGSGWTGMCTDSDAPGKTGETLLALHDIRTALRTALRRSNVPRLDLLAFDACMMAQLEVALAVSDLASTMVASEAIVPGTGYPYDVLLPTFATTTDAQQIGKAIVAAYAAHSEGEFKSGATMFALDLRKIPDVAQRLETVARQALLASEAHWPAIARALFFAENYEVRSARVSDGAVASIDLVDVAQRLRSVPGVEPPAIDDLVAAVAAAVLAQHGGAERTLSHGLSVFGPHRQGQWQPDYARTPLGAGSTWSALLQLVAARAAKDQGPLTVGNFRMQTARGKPTTTAAPGDGQRILFTATGTSLIEVQQIDMVWDVPAKAWTELRHQLVTDPFWPQRWAKAVAADMMDLVMPEYQDGSNELFAELHGMTFAVGNGAEQTLATLDMTTPSMQAPIAAVARYEPADGSAPELVQITFDRAWWRAVQVRRLAGPAPGVQPRAVEPTAADKFAMLLMTRDEAGKRQRAFASALAWGEAGLRLVPGCDKAGRYRVEMVARTIHGRTAAASHDYEVGRNIDLITWQRSWKDFDPATLVGTWNQFLVVGPEQYRDLKTTAQVAADPLGSHVFRVLQKGGPTGTEFETRQRWAFAWDGGQPSLRVITEVADGQTFCWYGPARAGVKDGVPFVAMKALNVGGVVWEWRKVTLASLRLK